MHEMAIVRDVMNVVLEQARQAHATEVKAVFITVGQGRDIVEDLFEGLFRHLARGTVAQKAEIVIRSVPFMVRCQECGLTYHIDVHNPQSWPCPNCGVKDYRLASGMEFSIDNIEVSCEAQTDGSQPEYVPAAKRNAQNTAA